MGGWPSKAPATQLLSAELPGWTLRTDVQRGAVFPPELVRALALALACSGDPRARATLAALQATCQEYYDLVNPILYTTLRVSPSAGPLLSLDVSRFPVSVSPSASPRGTGTLSGAWSPSRTVLRILVSLSHVETLVVTALPADTDGTHFLTAARTLASAGLVIFPRVKTVSLLAPATDQLRTWQPEFYARPILPPFLEAVSISCRPQHLCFAFPLIADRDYAQAAQVTSPGAYAFARRVQLLASRWIAVTSESPTRGGSATIPKVAGAVRSMPQSPIQSNIANTTGTAAATMESAVQGTTSATSSMSNTGTVLESTKKTALETSDAASATSSSPTLSVVTALHAAPMRSPGTISESTSDATSGTAAGTTRETTSTSQTLPEITTATTPTAANAPPPPPIARGLHSVAFHNITSQVLPALRTINHYHFAPGTRRPGPVPMTHRAWQLVPAVEALLRSWDAPVDHDAVLERTRWVMHGVERGVCVPPPQVSPPPKQMPTPPPPASRPVLRSASSSSRTVSSSSSTSAFISTPCPVPNATTKDHIIALAEHVVRRALRAVQNDVPDPGAFVERVLGNIVYVGEEACLACAKGSHDHEPMTLSDLRTLQRQPQHLLRSQCACAACLSRSSSSARSVSRPGTVVRSKSA